jgi:high-affinity iron transporter
VAVSSSLRLLLILCLMTIAPGLKAASPAEADVRQAWQLVEYIAVDYEGAVADGQIISEGEYAEMREFAATVSERIAQLPEVPQRAALQAAAGALSAQIEQRAAPAEVADAAHALARDLFAAYGVVAAPTKAPDLTQAPALYANLCASCHGVSGQGDGVAAVGMDPPPIAFTDAARAAQRSPLALFEVITQGLDGTAMVGYGNLPEADRWALAFHIAGMSFSDEQRAQGKARWDADAGLHAPLSDLGALAGASQAQLSASLGPDAATVLAYLRANPHVVTTVAVDGASLGIARGKLAESLAAYRAGEGKRAQTLALAAYLDGVEPIEPMLAVRDQALLRELEAAMARMRSGMRDQADVASVESMAADVTALFDRVDGVLVGSKADATAAFLGSFTILVREGLEALLIVIAMIAFLRRAERRDALRWVHVGWIGALVAGGITWVLATWLIDISGAQRELTEGFSALFAALVLLSVGIWMHQKSLAGRWQDYLKAKLSAAMTRRTAWFLFLLAFVATYREVFETILFYVAMWNPQDAGAIVAGFVSGAVVLAVIAFAMLRLGMRLPIGTFFAVSSVLIAVLAVVLVGKGVAALQEAGWISEHLLAVPRVDLLGIYPTWQSVLAQVVVAVIAVVGFWYNARGTQTATAGS